MLTGALEVLYVKGQNIPRVDCWTCRTVFTSENSHSYRGVAGKISTGWWVARAVARPDSLEYLHITNRPSGAFWCYREPLNWRFTSIVGTIT